MVKRVFLWICFILLLVPVSAQRKKKLNTNGEGTMFIKAGYNRAAFSDPNTVLSGDNYTATLEELNISDNEQGSSIARYFDDSSPQFNFQIGYFVAPKWSIILGFDRYNTFFTPDQQIGLTGTFAPGSHGSFEGTYDAESISLDRNDFNLRQEQGVNYFNVGVLRMDQLYKSRKASFSFNTVVGAKLGPVFTTVDYTFDDYTRQQVSSLSGIGFTGFAGVRLDFFQHVFFEADLVGGYLNQNNIDLSTNGSETAEQKAAYFSPQINLGVSFFVRPTNGCGTCPQW